MCRTEKVELLEKKEDWRVLRRRWRLLVRNNGRSWLMLTEKVSEIANKSVELFWCVLSSVTHPYDELKWMCVFNLTNTIALLEALKSSTSDREANGTSFGAREAPRHRRVSVTPRSDTTQCENSLLSFSLACRQEWEGAWQCSLPTQL